MFGLGPAGLMIMQFLAALGGLLAAHLATRVWRWRRGRAQSRGSVSQG